MQPNASKQGVGSKVILGQIVALVREDFSYKYVYEYRVKELIRDVLQGVVSRVL